MIDLDFAIERLEAWGIGAQYPALDDFDGELTIDELPKDYIMGGTSFYTFKLTESNGMSIDICFHHVGELKNMQEFLAGLSANISELEVALYQVVEGRETYEERLKYGIDW